MIKYTKNKKIWEYCLKNNNNKNKIKAKITQKDFLALLGCYSLDTKSNFNLFIIEMSSSIII